MDCVWSTLAVRRPACLCTLHIPVLCQRRRQWFTQKLNPTFPFEVWRSWVAHFGCAILKFGAFSMRGILYVQNIRPRQKTTTQKCHQKLKKFHPGRLKVSFRTTKKHSISSAHIIYSYRTDTSWEKDTEEKEREREIGRDTHHTECV